MCNNCDAMDVKDKLIVFLNKLLDKNYDLDVEYAYADRVFPDGS